MEFLEELREKVVKETIWDEEKYFALSRDLKRIKTLPEADARKLLLEAMSYTGTWLSTRDLSEVLKTEDYTKIAQCAMADIEERYAVALANNPEKEDVIKQEIDADFEETFFAIKKVDDEYKLKEAPYGINEYQVNYDEIDVQALKKVTISSMQRHLDADVFHDQKGRKKEWIKNILSQAVKELSEEPQGREEV